MVDETWHSNATDISVYPLVTSVINGSFIALEIVLEDLALGYKDDWSCKLWPDYLDVGHPTIQQQQKWLVWLETEDLIEDDLDIIVNSNNSDLWIRFDLVQFLK